MTTLGSALLAIGGLTALIGSIWLIVVAFRKNALWGLGSLIVPFVALIFVIMHWDKSGKPFLINLIGIAVFVVGGRVGDIGSGGAPLYSPLALDAVKAQIDANTEIHSLFRVCPADVAEKTRPFWRSLWSSLSISEEDCGKDIEACYKECLDWRNENACLALARIFEERKPVADPIHAQMLYAEACATGLSSGCTNRAAGIRNGQFDGDPMLNSAPQVLASCYFRTFQFSCGKGDGWGCTMLGQSHQVGEGVEPSMSEARRYYLRSCEIDGNFPSCDFARKRLEQLDGKEPN